MVRASGANKFLRSGFHVRGVGCRLRFQAFVELLEQYFIARLNAKLRWLPKPVRLSAIRRKNGVWFSPFETTKLGRQSNLRTGILRRDAKFVDFIRTVLYFATTLQDQYHISSNDPRTADIG